MTIATVVLSSLALLTYIGLIATLCTLHSSDAAGNGLSQAFGALLTVVLWVLIAGVVLLLLRRAGWPAGPTAAGVILVVLSGSSALAAGHLLNDGFYRVSWPLVVPAVLPLVLVGCAAMLAFPAWRPALSASAFATTTGVIGLMLAIAPWPEVIRRARHGAADRDAARVAAEADAPARAEAARRRNRAAFDALGADAELSAWLEFCARDNELRDRALAEIRQRPQRQAEFEAMLARGYDYLIDEVAAYGLEPTPTVLNAARRHLFQKATELKPRSPENPPAFAAMAERIAPTLPAIRWLVNCGGDCGAELDAIEAAVRQYRPAAEREMFLRELAEARRS